MDKRKICRKEASQSTPEARGLPCPAAAWKGMGPCGYRKPPSLAIPQCLGYLMLLGVIFMSVEGFAQSEGCHVERCSDEYQMARQDLDIAGPGPHNSKAECTALRTYRHCITKTVGCQGNIMYYTLRNIVRQQMEEHNCTANGETVEPSPDNSKRQMIVPAICMYQGKKIYRHCALFGDPHLRTFYEEFQTCKVKGAWPLVNNDYLIVQVTNDPVEGNTDATATSKLTVIVKGNPECTSKDFATYQAQSNSLPGTFDDGRVSVGPYKSLELVEVEAGHHVEIHIRYINTVVVVRQIGRYFTFSIKMPEELVNQSRSSPDLQLCVRGCPQSELINYQEYLATRKYSSSSVSHGAPSVDIGSSEAKPAVTRAEAEKVCRNAKLVDFYFDSCVFDLMATGDQNFTLSALGSLQDILKLHPSAARTMANRTSLDAYDRQYGGGNSGHGSVWQTQSSYQLALLLILTLLVSVMCSR